MNTQLQPTNPLELPVKSLAFVPCKVCGAIEHEVTAGVYRIDHDFVKHGLPERVKAPRMSTDDLMGIPKLEELFR